jgi:hypothetical protein
MTWPRPRRRRLVTEEVFADAAGLQLIRVNASATLVRLPPVLPDLDVDFQPQNEGEPPLVEVADLERAVRRLTALGFDVGPIEELGWEAVARLTVPSIGTFRLIGPWLPGWPPKEVAIDRISE